MPQPLKQTWIGKISTLIFPEDTATRLTPAGRAALRRWVKQMLIVSLGGILFLTLFPFNFDFTNLWERLASGYSLSPQSPQTGFIRDFVANIFFFMPLGFCIAYLRLSRNQRPLTSLLIAAGLSALVSFTVETLQIYLFSRFSSMSDLVSNSIGGAAGWWLGHYYGERLLLATLRLLRRFVSPGWAGICAVLIAAHLLNMIHTTITLPDSLRISDWNPNYALLIGNEQVGRRGWRGTIYSVEICNQAVSPEAVERLYRNGNHMAALGILPLISFHFEANGTNPSPAAVDTLEMIWKGAGVPDSVTGGLVLDGSRWLESSKPATELTRAIEQTGRMTLSAVVAPADTLQGGPVRIVSLSRDFFQRNFTLGQHLSHLYFRLRTPLSGRNGTNPQLIVPGIFSPGQPLHLALTYDGSEIVLYRNGVRHPRSLRMIPEMAYFSRRTTLIGDVPESYLLLYDIAVCFPVGLLLVFVMAGLGFDRKSYALRLTLLALLLVLCYELIRSSILGAPLELPGIFLRAAIILLTYSLFRFPPYVDEISHCG